MTMGARAVARLAAALAACAAALAGCASEPAPSPTAPPEPEGAHFVGRMAGGLGASVDFGGFDPVARAVRRALAAAAGPAHVGIASLVNDGGQPVPLPRFVAVDRLGERHPIATAARALGALPGAGARRARAAVGQPTAVPAEGSAVVYLVLRGASPGDLSELRMLRPGGPSATLERRGR